MTSARNRPEWGSNDTHALLNSDIPRVDGPEKVTGRAIYTHDIRLPQMVYARLVVCPYPRAKIKSQSYRKARKVPGVVHGAPFKEVGDSIAFQGADGVVGAIVAETPEAAAAGLCGVKIDYEVLEPVVTPEDALAPGAPVVGRRGNVTGLSSSGDRAEVEAALSE